MDGAKSTVTLEKEVNLSQLQKELSVIKQLLFYHTKLLKYIVSTQDTFEENVLANVVGDGVFETIYSLLGGKNWLNNR
ncbi:MAG: hypothetical protein RRY36_08145 [Bacteroidaceae bacterium]